MRKVKTLRHWRVPESGERNRERTIMIRVITIEREYGSGGADIAKKIADRLGWKLWDQLLTNEIARLMECDCRVVEEHEEKRDPLYYRLLKAFMRGSYEGSLNAPRLKMADTDCIREVAERVVRDAADAASASLWDAAPPIICKAVATPFTCLFTLRWMRRSGGSRPAERARAKRSKLIETVDRDRAAFIKQYFDVEWPDRQRFHRND